MNPEMNNELTLDEAMQFKLLEQEYENVKPYTGFNSLYEHAVQMQKNEIAIIKSIQEAELRYYVKHDGALLSEASINLDDVRTLAKNLIGKVLHYLEVAKDFIVSVWKALIAKYEKLDIANKFFYNKYGKLLKTDASIDYEGYDFSRLDERRPKDLMMVPSEVNKEKDFTEGQIDTIKSRMAHEIIYGSGVSSNTPIKTDEQFTQEAHDWFYGGEKKKRSYKINDQLNYIKDTNKLKADTSRAFKNTDTAIKAMIVYTRTLNIASFNTSESIKNVLDLMIANAKYDKLAYELYVGALKDRNLQAKAICIKALEAGLTKEATVEEKPHIAYREASIESYLMA